MENNFKKVKFDPGYAPIVIDALGQVGYTYYTFSAIRDFKLKKLNFPHTLRKIEKFLKTNIAFYLGCLMWGAYIKQFSDCEIEGNKLLGEICEEEEYTSEINFLIDFVKNQLPKDSKYYLGKDYPINGQYLTILDTYKQFLILNKGFTNVSNVAQIVLPDNIKNLDKEQLDILSEKIEAAISKKNLDSLLDDSKMILD